MEVLYIREIPAHGACSRRPTIEKPPEWAQSVLEFESLTRNISNEEALYELEIEGRYWSSEYAFSSSEEYIQLVEGESKGRYFYRGLNQITDKSMDELKNEWSARVQKEHIGMVLWKTGDWLSLVVSIVFLAFSIVWFNKWATGQENVKWVFASFFGQSVIMLLAFLSVNSWNNFLIAFMGLLVPGVWFYEVIHFIIVKVGRK